MVDEVFDIESIFEDIPEDEIPNNRPKCIKFFDPFKIVPGADAKNIFLVNVEKDEENIEILDIIYRQMNKVVLHKVPNSTTKNNNILMVEVTLAPAETLMFANSLLRTEAQIKLQVGDDIMLSPIFRMHVMRTIED